MAILTKPPFRRALALLGLFQTVSWQRHHWRQELVKEAAGSWNELGHRWGNPENAQDRLGNYRHIRELLQANFNASSTVLELGSYGGKWTQYLLPAKRVICVDLFEDSRKILQKRFPEAHNLEFYRTRGDELMGIPSNTVDLVFFMDTLTKSSRSVIKRYLSEIYRVLAPGGYLLAQLPKHGYSLRGGVYFRVTLPWLEKTIAGAGFRGFTLDESLLLYGVLLQGRKEASLAS